MTSRGPVVAATGFSVATTRPVEAISTVTPLGIQLWDMLSDEPIRRRLNVAVRSCPGDARAIPAFATPAGVHAFRNLPGLRPVEFPAATVVPPPDGGLDTTFADSLPGDAEHGQFVLTVEDPDGQFNPATMVVPAPYTGLVTTSALLAGCAESLPAGPPAGSLPDPDPPIYLSSAPTRSLPPGTAAVRAQLRTTTGEAPGNAVLDIEVALPDGSTMRHAGSSDENGSVLVPFPYPTFAVTTGPSPPAGVAGSPLEAQCWDITVRVLYEPDALVRIADIATPTLTSVLSQAPTPIWETLTVSAPELSTQLCFGSELVLKTTDHDRPDLLIGASSP